MVKKKIRKRYKALPPHTWEAHSTNQGEVNKQLIIAAITVGAIIILAVLLFFSDRFVGKAIEFADPTEIGHAGIFTPTGT